MTESSINTDSIVAVVGSKPNPVLPSRIDTIVFCNGSINLDKKRWGSPRQVWHAMTNSVLCKDKEGAELVRQQLHGKKVDRLIEVTSLSLNQLDYEWKDFGYSYKDRTEIKNAEKGELSFSVINSWFFFDLFLAPCPTREKISVFWNAVWRKKYPAASTGLLALLAAMKLSPEKEKTFVVCGIGLENDGYAFARVTVPRGHICVDYCVLRALSRLRGDRRVFVTDKTLSRRAGLPWFNMAATPHPE